jgi:alpha-L-rhamnosidase
MMNMNNVVPRNLFTFCLLVTFVCAAHADIEIADLSCEYSVNPIAVDTRTPRFSWVLDSSERGQRQSAYQILVADSAEALSEDRGSLWDSGRVASSSSAHVSFAGTALESSRTYHWKVRVWDANGIASPYSQPAHFGTGLFVPEDWKAKWIARAPEAPLTEEGAAVPPVEHDGRSTLLRKEFQIGRSVLKARVNVCGLGLYELYLNGDKVGNDALMPPKTNYAKQVLYNTYDVTEQLNNGVNAFGIMLGNGWFSPYEKYRNWRMQWFGSQKAIVQLHVDYTDGTSDIFTSDESWKASTGAIIHSCIYDGETYDATLEQAGWDIPGFDDSTWTEVNVVESPGGTLVPQMMEAIRVTEVIDPVALTNPKPGVWVFDMGQNFAGWSRLSVKGPKGTVVNLRYAENLAKNGMLDRETLGDIAEGGVRGVYTLKGEGVEVYEPRFCFFGFRYVEVTGFPGTPTLESLQGCVVHSDCPTVGTFACGNALVNRVHRCTLWSQRSNMIGYPMDCPQRDERLGWMGDAHVSAEEAMHNFHMPLFYENWLKGVQLNQDEATGDLPYISPRPYMKGESPAWSSAYHLIIWYQYLHYGDTWILEEHFENMTRYVDYLGTTGTDLILPREWYGDWLSLAYGWEKGDPESTPTGYFHYTAALVAKVAKVLGKADDERRYAQLAGEIKDAYNKRFFNPETKQYESGTHCANTFPLFLGITPPEDRAAVLQNLVDSIMVNKQGHLTTGILGTKYMMELLTREGLNDVAHVLASQTDYPSWGNLTENRTTLSEQWSQTGSNNHVMFGSVDAWFYRVLAGLNVDEARPGFEHVIIKPYFHPEIGWVRCSLETVRGMIRSNWKIQEDSLLLDITIPANVIATVYLPADDVGQVVEGGKPVQETDGVQFLRMEGDCAVLAVGSGSYAFVSGDVGALLPKRRPARPEIQPEGTFIEAPNTVTIDLTSATEGAAIYYTLDGSEPTENSLRFLEPFVLRETKEIRVKAFKEGCLPSLTRSREYEFVTQEGNGLDYELYGEAFRQLPDFDTLTPSQTGHVYRCALDEVELFAREYALRFKGSIEIKEGGEYTFYAVSNDGSQLFINDKMVVNNDGAHGSIERSGTIHLTSGLHPFMLTYFQSGRAYDLQVLYEGPGIEKQVIPAPVFHRTQK